eukprot:1075061-Pleurochrysis_carterae.AAC.2
MLLLHSSERSCFPLFIVPLMLFTAIMSARPTLTAVLLRGHQSTTFKQIVAEEQCDAAPPRCGLSLPVVPQAWRSSVQQKQYLFTALSSTSVSVALPRAASDLLSKQAVRSFGVRWLRQLLRNSGGDPIELTRRLRALPQLAASRRPSGCRKRFAASTSAPCAWTGGHCARCAAASELYLNALQGDAGRHLAHGHSPQG